MKEVKVMVIILMVLFPAAALSATVEVTIDENGFDPPGFTIQKGDTVRWTNNGTSDHSVISGNGGVADGYIDSGLLKPGESFEFTFSLPAPDYAAVRYFDSADPSNSGAVAVNFGVAISPGNSVLVDSEEFRLFVVFFSFPVLPPFEPQVLVSFDGYLVFQGSLREFENLSSMINFYVGGAMGPTVVIPIPPYTLPPGVHTLSVSVTSQTGEVIASDKAVYTVLKKGEIVDF